MAKSQSERQQAADDIFANAFSVEERVEVEAPRPIPDGAVITLPRGEFVPWAKNPRKVFSKEKLQELGTKMRAEGQNHELLVRPLAGRPGFWEILGGERRWRCGDREFGGEQQTDIPFYRARVRYPKNDVEAFDIAWNDNELSLPLTQMEKWEAIEARLQLARELGEGDSYRAVGKLAGMNYERARQVENMLALPSFITERFDELELNEKHARGLSLLRDNPDEQRALFRAIERSGMSGNAALKKAQEARKQLEKEREAEAASQQPALFPTAESGTETAEAEAPATTTRTVELETNANSTPAQTGNPDDGEFEDDNWRSGVAAQNAGNGSGAGGVASSAPVAEGSGFATAPATGQTIKQGPRQAPPLPGGAVADELRAIARYYADGYPIAAKLDEEVESAITEIASALADLESARAARKGNR